MRFPVRYEFSPAVSAYATGNEVVITTGMAAKVGPMLLPAIAAHEQGHLVLRHRRRAVTFSMGLCMAGLLSLCIFVWTGESSWIGAAFLCVLALGWGQKKLRHAYEFAADRYAVEHGFGTDLARALNVLRGYPESDTHPDIDERIRRIYAAEEKWLAKQKK